jgi:SAM-dependent methyltransferase
MTNLIDIGPSAAAPSERDPRDYYPTPHELTSALVPYLPPYNCALDLGCGTGSILDVLSDARGLARTYGVELDQELAKKASEWGHAVYLGDVLQSQDAALPAPTNPRCVTTIRRLGEQADVIVMNPPFKHAQAFAETALAIRRPWATVAVLLRGTFMEGIERLDFHRRYPAEILVIPNRVDFTRGRLRDCPTCEGTGVVAKAQPRKPGSKIDPHRCDGCAGKKWVKGGVDSAAVYWWVFRPELRVGTYRHLDPVIVPKES